MKKCYDIIVDARKKTSSVDVFDVLQAELQDCFNALKEVNPDQVYSSRRVTELGNKKECNVNNSNINDDEETTETQPGTSNGAP